MKHFTLMISAVALSFAASAQLDDSGFEAGPGTGNWTEFSQTFGTPLCDAASCGICGGPCVPHSGTWYVWYGGANAPESAYVEQFVDIPSGNSASLKFFLKLPTGDPTITGDKFEVLMDGSVIFMASAADMANYAEYTEVTVNISSFANGGAHYLKAQGFQTTATVFNALVDDFSLVVNGNTVGVIDFEKREISLAVYPNPATDVINIQFGDAVSGAGVVNFYSLTGELVLSKNLNEVNSKVFSYDATTLAKGMYIVAVQAGGLTHTERIVVQ